MSYRPYRSGSDTGTGSASASASASEYGSDSDGSMYSESVAQQLAGPDFATFAKQLKYNKNQLGPDVNYYPFDMSGVDIVQTATFKDKQNILLIDSRNRDRSIFPYASLFTIRLPRTYRNVSFLQLAQINLLSAFFYFNATKQNISFPIYEQGRTTPTGLGTPGSPLMSTITNVQIREGSYGITDLLTEIQLQCNNVPLFFDFPNGFTDFSELFTSTGDYALNFNSPGDSVYDREHQRYILSPTTVQIINFYFQTNGLTVATTNTSYSLSQTQVAYYYPVLKELYLDTANPLNASLNVLGFGVDQNDRILYSFQGLNDPVILAMILANISTLDQYRIQHTFLYANANEYIWSYETNNNRISVVSSNLNNSLVNLLNQKYNYFLTNALIGTGVTNNQFSALYAEVIQGNAIFNSMYRYLQTSIASNWAVTYGSYSPEFYLNLSNVLFLQNSCNLTGYNATQYVNTISASNITKNTTIKNNSPNYWPNMQNMISNNVIENPKQIGYSFIGNDILQLQDFTDLSGFLNINLTTRSIDIAANILPANYTYFKFRSPVKQNLQVETLPRPIGYRYVNYNAANYSQGIQSYFDLSYSFVENVLNQEMNNLLIPPTVISETPLQNSINVLQPVKYYTYTAGKPSAYPDAALLKYEVTVTFSAINGTFEDGLQIFMYHDFGVFNADIVNYGNENASHYKYKASATNANSNTTIQFMAVNNNNYYFILRATNRQFNTTNYTVSITASPTIIPIYNTLVNFNPYANPASRPTNYNYATLYDPDILRLPSYSNLFNAEPVNPLLSNNGPYMGADAYYNSDDLTDYRPYIAGNPIVPTSVTLGSVGIDPLQDFTFQYLSPYNSTQQTYVYQTSNNTDNKVLDVNLNPYKVNNTKRDYKIVQWNSQTYIPTQTGDIQYSGDFAGDAFTSNLVDISGYVYDINNNIKLGNGIVGFTFLPSDGIWNLQEMWFKSAVLSENDPNASIKYLGIFYTLDVYGKGVNNLNLSNAATVLTLGSTMKYSQGSQYDQIGGTYYQFLLSSSSAIVDIYGYTQNSNTIITNPDDFYCAIAFADSNTTQTIVGLAGTTVPYPEFSFPSSSSSYFGVVPPPQASYLSSPSVVMPYPILPYNINPTAGLPPKSIYYSQYEQSMPIITTGIQYLTTQEPILNSNGLIPFREPIQGDAFSFYWADKFVMNNQYLQAWQYAPNMSTQAEYTWTLDTLFSPANSESFVTFCTAQSNMYLFGLQGENVIIKGFDELTGQVQNITLKTPTLLSSELVQRFFMRVSPSQTTQYVFSTYEYVTSTSRYYINKNATLNDAVAISTIDGGHDMWCDPSSNNIYILPYNLGTEGNLLYSLGFDSQPSSNLSSIANKYYRLDQPTTTNVPITGYRTVTTDFRENIYLLSPQLPNNYFQIRNSIQYIAGGYYDTTIWNSQQLFEDPITHLQCGYTGSLWAITAGESSQGGQTMYGAIPNTNSLMTTIAWQIFYPCFKARFTKKFNYVNTITDTYSQKGDIVQYPEYTHPQLFFYRDWKSFSNDCYRKFGKETASNLAYQDLSGYGYNFNTYIYDIALDKSSNFDDNDPDSYYYLVLRGYSPTEQFGCMTRFFLPQRYDFGYTSMNTIIDEIGKISQEPLSFNPDFSNALTVFDRRFYTTQIYGENVVAGFNGSTITTYGFKDYLTQYSTIYSSFASNSALVNRVASNVASNLSNYVNRYLSRILPSTALQRLNIQNSLSYTLMFKSGITDQTLLNTPDSWGIGWNLGFSKADYGGFTFYKAPSFYKILDEYLYLKMNPEFNLNRLDTTELENLAVSRDPQGNVNQYAAKLLLANFGSYTTSLVQNGANFNPPIEKLDTLFFEWVDINGNQLSNTDCDWDASIQITESIETLAIPKNRVANGFLKF